MANPFYVKLGYTLPQIAGVSKLYGIWVGMVGAFAGGWSIARFGLFPTLVVGAAIGAGSQSRLLVAGRRAARDLAARARDIDRQFLGHLRRDGADGLHVGPHRHRLCGHPIRASSRRSTRCPGSSSPACRASWSRPTGSRPSSRSPPAIGIPVLALVLGFGRLGRDLDEAPGGSEPDAGERLAVRARLDEARGR